MIGPTLSAKRIQNELKQVMANEPEFWHVDPVETTPKRWVVIVDAPSTTPFHTVSFKLFVDFPENYPDKKANLSLEKNNSFFHPNISRDGKICDKSVNEKARTTMTRERIDAFINLLAVPNPEDPWNSAASELYRSEPNKYYRKALRIYRGFENLPV